MEETTAQVQDAAQETPQAPVAEPEKVEQQQAQNVEDAYLAARARAKAGVRTAEPEAKVPEPKPAEAAAPKTVKEPDKEPEPKPERILPHRIPVRQFNEIEQEAIVLLRDLRKEDENVTLKDAYILVEKRHEEARKAHVEPEPQVDPLADLRKQVADLDAKLDEAGENEGLFGKEQVKLVRDRADLAAKLAKAEAKLELRQETAQVSQQERENAVILTAFEKSKAEAIQIYPDLGDDSTELGREANAYIEELKQPGNPDAAILEMKNAPALVAREAVERLARRVAEEKGISVTEAITGLMAKPLAKAAPPAAKMAPKITPASGAATSSPAPAKPKFTDWHNGEAVEKRFQQRRAELKAQRQRSGFAGITL